MLFPSTCLEKSRDEYIRVDDLQPPYPEIAANQADFTFVVGKEDQHSELPIFGRDRKLVYRLRCSAGLWISGQTWAIGCRLFATGNQVGLLADGIDPYTRRSRAVFIWDHVSQACRDYPEWGASRDFDLRGMKISFVESVDFENQLWAFGESDPAFGRPVKLHVQVKPDPSAQSPVAMPIKVVDWLLLKRHKACKEIFTH